MSGTFADQQHCCCIGCRESADVVIDHPRHGERTVCEDHVNGYEVIRRV